MAGKWLNSAANTPSAAKVGDNDPEVVAQWEKLVAGNVPEVLVSYDEIFVDSYDKLQDATGLYLQFYDQKAGRMSTILCLSTALDEDSKTTLHLQLVYLVIARLEKEGRKNKDAQLSMCLGYALCAGGKFKATSCSNLRPTGGDRRLTPKQENALEQMCNKALSTKVASLPHIEAIEEYLEPRIKDKMDGWDLDFVKRLVILGVGKGMDFESPDNVKAERLFKDVMSVTKEGLVSEGTKKEKAEQFLKAVVEMNWEMALEKLNQAKTNNSTDEMRSALAKASEMVRKRS